MNRANIKDLLGLEGHEDTVVVTMDAADVIMADEAKEDMLTIGAESEAIVAGIAQMDNDVETITAASEALAGNEVGAEAVADNLKIIDDLATEWGMSTTGVGAESIDANPTTAANIGQEAAKDFIAKLVEMIKKAIASVVKNFKKIQLKAVAVLDGSAKKAEDLLKLLDGQEGVTEAKEVEEKMAKAIAKKFAGYTLLTGDKLDGKDVVELAKLLGGMKVEEIYADKLSPMSKAVMDSIVSDAPELKSVLSDIDAGVRTVYKEISSIRKVGAKISTLDEVKFLKLNAGEIAYICGLDALRCEFYPTIEVPEEVTATNFAELATKAGGSTVIVKRDKKDDLSKIKVGLASHSELKTIVGDVISAAKIVKDMPKAASGLIKVIEESIKVTEEKAKGTESAEIKALAKVIVGYGNKEITSVIPNTLATVKEIQTVLAYAATMSKLYK
jgi:hypothetical protein